MPAAAPRVQHATAIKAAVKYVISSIDACSKANWRSVLWIGGRRIWEGVKESSKAFLQITSNTTASPPDGIRLETRGNPAYPSADVVTQYRFQAKSAQSWSVRITGELLWVSGGSGSNRNSRVHRRAGSSVRISVPYTGVAGFFARYTCFNICCSS